MSIDELYEDLFGQKPKKLGTSYELISAAVCKLLSEESSVYHDKRIRGALSKTLYQIDVEINSEQGKYLGECKDYSERNDKVGRGDIQKLAGGLIELDANGGLFFSATNYTKPAIKYADSSIGILGKEIHLFELRPTVEQDLEGRIKKIIIDFIILEPDFDGGKYEPVFTSDGEETIQQLIDNKHYEEGQAVSLTLSEIYDVDGKQIVTLKELTLGNPCYPNCIEATGSYLTPGGHIQMNGRYVGIYGITYKIPCKSIFDSSLVIEAEGEPKIIIKSRDGLLNKLITDEQLKNVRFDSNGEAVIIK